jgi:hypothetical protein
MNKKINVVFFRSKKKIIAIAAIISCFIIYASCTGNESKSGKEELISESEEMVTASITVTPNVPLDLNDPSNLAEAANFAWNEFIALTWPADSASRGKPLASGKYGDKGPGGHVVWETYRARVEAFPAIGNPNGYDPAKPDLGFSSPPDYIYQPNGGSIDPSGHVMPYPGTNPGATTPAHNMDEVTQITLNTMYAGIAATAHAGTPGTSTSVNQKILFEAKVNEEYYKYVTGNKYFQSEDASVMKIKTNSIGYAETGDAQKYPPPYMNLPASDSKSQNVGTIEIKASFRRLNSKTEDITKFFTAPVRYYANGGGRGIKGFYDSDAQNEVWGLVSLHIIHKTPNAPAFVYATFSQYNNILDSSGNSVEDEVGNTLEQYKNMEPFSPALSITNDSNSSPTNPQSVYVKSGSVNTNSPQLYFHNAMGKEAIYTDASKKTLYTLPVNINRRLFMIPDIIVNANKNAHQAIKSVNPNAVWLNYKLINVQAEPLDYKRDYARIFQGGEQSLAATFFLANEVVETNPSLQNFSGGLNSATGNINNKVYPDGITPPAVYDYNVFVRQAGKPVGQYNMGGCMGCHGSQGQKAGGDFSVLLANGRISLPDPIEEDEQTAEAVEKITKKYFPKRFNPK